jgi:cobalamin biosynthesis protein CobT
MNRIEILREKITKLTGLLTDKKVKVTQRGAQAFVRYSKDGIPELVNIPYIPDNATEEFTQAVEGFLDHEVAHVLFSSGDVIILADKKGVGGFHNATEDIFIEGVMSKKFPGSKINLETMHGLFIRDYVDAEYQKNTDKPVQYLLVALLRAYAGQRAFQEYIEDKMVVLKDVDARLGEYCRDALPKMKSSMDALIVALEIKRLLEEKKEKPKGTPNKGTGETPEEEGKSGNSTKDDNKEEKDDNDGADGKSKDEDEDSSSSPSNKTETDNGGNSDKLGDDVSSDGDDTDEDDDGSDGDAGDASGTSDDDTGESKSDANDDGDNDDSKPEKQSGEDTLDSDGESVESESGSESESGENGNADKEASSEDSEVGEGEQSGEKHESAHQDLDGNALTPFDGTALQKVLKDFDEAMSELITREAIEISQDSDYLIYTRDLDIIEKFDIDKRGGVSGDAVRTMQDKVDHMVGKIQKDLERAVAAQNKVQQTSGHRSGRLDASGLGRLIQFGDEKVFKRKQVTKAKNTAISLLIDCSGSMSDYGKIETASYAAYALSTTLERLGINHEVLGFTTADGRPDEAISSTSKTGVEYSRYENLYIPIFKSFGERLNSKSKAAIASLANAEWLGNNVDGESVAIAASRLAQQKEERKILIVLSDGNPVAFGNKSQLRAHLKSTINSIIKSRIEVLGIGINDDAVKEYYPKHLVIRNIKELPTTVIGEIRNFLTK